MTELQKLVVSMRDILKTEKEEETLQAIQMHQNSEEKTKTLKSKNDCISALRKRSSGEE